MIKVGEYPRQMQWFKLHLELLHEALDHFSRDPAALKTFVEDQEKKFSDGLNVYLKTEEDPDYVVKSDESSEARRYFTFGPSFCCLQAVKLYPTHFAEK